MKKILSLILALVMCLSMAACGGPEEPGESKGPGESEEPSDHTCSGEWVVLEGATCLKEGTRRRTCSCGDVTTETIPVSAHTYVDGACEICGGMDPDYYPASYGLEFVDIGDGELKLVGLGSCTDEIVVIPEYEGPFRVTAIERKAFLNNKKITAVIIPDSVKTIGEEAFKGCTKLTSAIIGDSIEIISKSAFARCSSLAFVELGSAVKTIGQYAFSDCDALTAIVIPEAVTKIESYAFSDCDGITSVNIPGNPGLVLHSRLFSSCDSLRTVVIGSGIESIPSLTFYNCPSLVEVTLPDTLKAIDNGAFEDCSALERITLPNGVTKIYSEAFRDCTALTEIVIPESVTELGSGAFYACTKLKKVTINATVMLEYNYQFENCSALTAIHVPEALEEEYASSSWRELSAVLQLPHLPTDWWDTSLPASEGLEFISYGNGTCYISGRGSCVDTVIKIPEASPTGDAVVEIGDYAFADGLCYDITKIIVPNTVTKLGDHAFEGCTNLQSLDLPESIIAGDTDVIYDCYDLTVLILRCKVILDWPKDVVVRPEESFFEEITVYVPVELVEEYKAAPGWKLFGDNIQAIAE